MKILNLTQNPFLSPPLASLAARSVGLDSDNKKVFLQKQTCFEAAVDAPQKYDKDGFISPNSKKIKWGR